MTTRIGCGSQIEPFDEDLQDRYFSNDIGARWLETVPNRDEQQDLLGLPLVLRMIRQLIENTPTGQPLPQFHTLSELFLAVNQLLLKRAIEKSAEELKQAGLELGIGDAKQFGLLERVISLLAFQMMLEENYNGIIDGSDDPIDDPIEEFETRAGQRFVAAVESESKRQQLKLQWDWALKVLKTIELNHRSTTEAYVPERLAFRSRKVVECYAARYLTKFATPADIASDDVRRPCAADFTGDQNEWHNCWQLAIEMPAGQRDDIRVRRVMDLLFGRPRRGLRPTELMFRAWQMMQRTSFPYFDEVLAGYRQQFLDILAGAEDGDSKDVAFERAQRAAEVIRSEHLRTLADDGQLGWSFEELCPRHPAYVLCCDEDNREHLTFWMGTADDSEHGFSDEKPRHRVQVDAFEMAACCVTRAQYRLFDPQLEQAYKKRFDEVAPEDDCPVIEMNWYDSVCFALWLGDEYGLPSETEWEGAARGRRDGPQDVIGIPPYDETFTSDEVNFDGNYSLSGEMSAYLERTLPVRWNEQRRAEAVATDSGTKWPPWYRKNRFGIWHAHGNVWEWCESVWDEEIYQRRVEKNDADVIVEVRVDAVAESAASVRRVLRGGSWRFDAVHCRSSSRFLDVPVNRFDFGGFRLCCQLRSVSPESSSH